MSRAIGERGGFWPIRDLPTPAWLLATLIAAVIHPVVPAPRWLLIHLLLLGAVSHAILVWSRHFAVALLHLPGDDAERAAHSRRLWLLNAGVVAVVAGVLTQAWVLTVAGAVAVATAAGWHACELFGQVRRALPARFAGTVRCYIAAAGFLPAGAGLGAALARGVADPWHERLVTAHAVVNVLGWIGISVVGTLVTLWPTMLRTRIAEGAERSTARALPVLATSTLVAAGGAVAGLRLVAAVGIAGYLAGLALTAPAFVEASRNKPPVSFASWSVLAGLAWLVGSLSVLAIGVGTASSWADADATFAAVTPFLAAGFGAQVLVGALAYLVPVAMGGGPRPVRAANAALDHGGPLRVVMTNAGLVVSALPTPSAVRVAASVVALAGLAPFLPLLVVAIRSSRRTRAAQAAPPHRGARQPASIGASRTTSPGASRTASPEAPRSPGHVSGLAVTGLAVVVLGVAAGVALDPAATARGGSPATASAGVVATGATSTLEITAKDMRFTPSRISVPAGNRLVIVLTNADSDVHDLVLDAGASSGRLSPGDSTRLDVGIVGRDIEGWCSVVGHRQMGMTMRIDVTGRTKRVPTGRGNQAAHRHGPAASSGNQHQSPDPSSNHRLGDIPTATPAPVGPLDFMAAPRAGFVARDAVLPPLGKGRLHRHTFRVAEVVREVAPGVTARLWAFNGSVPGPVLHGRVGDEFEIRLVNDATIGHSIDFHAGSLAPDRPMRTIPPGGSLTYRFTATRAGIWMYHCSSMPMSAHIAAGLFGAVVIEPPELPRVDRSYVLAQSELYLSGRDGPVDAAKVHAEGPDAVVFNGYANQYDHRPLPAKVGERVRIWVLDAGPNRPTSFHVVGGQFDAAWSEGGYSLRSGENGGAQALGLLPAQGGFVELVFPEPGRYPFVSHLMVDAERGAHGAFKVGIP